MSLYNGLHDSSHQILTILSKLLEIQDEFTTSTINLGLDFIVNSSFNDIYCFKELIVPFIISRTSHKTKERSNFLLQLIELSDHKDEFIMLFLHSNNNK